MGKLDNKTKRLSRAVNDRVWEEIEKLKLDPIIEGRLKGSLSKVITEEIFKANPYEGQQLTYLREQKDLERLEETRIQITNYLTVEPTMSISELARNLNMSRQALYKNLELKELIQELKADN